MPLFIITVNTALARGINWSGDERGAPDALFARRIFSELVDPNGAGDFGFTRPTGKALLARALALLADASQPWPDLVRATLTMALKGRPHPHSGGRPGGQHRKIVEKLARKIQLRSVCVDAVDPGGGCSGIRKSEVIATSVRILPFLNRVKNEHLRKSAEACFVLADALSARRAELDSSNKFTNEGKSAELADALRQEFAPKLRALQAPVVQAMQEAELQSWTPRSRRQSQCRSSASRSRHAPRRASRKPKSCRFSFVVFFEQLPRKLMRAETFASIAGELIPCECKSIHRASARMIWFSRMARWILSIIIFAPCRCYARAQIPLSPHQS